MFAARPCNGGSWLSVAEPLRNYACEVEGYRATDTIEGGKSDARPELWQQASQAYLLTSNTLAWIVAVFIFVTSFNRLFGNFTIVGQGLPSADYSLGVSGVDGCLDGFVKITSPADCAAGSSALGLQYRSSLNDGNAASVCFLCEGCDPQTVRVSTGHGGLAQWLCKKDVPTLRPALPPALPFCSDAGDCEELFASEIPVGTQNNSGLQPLPPGCAAQGHGGLAARCPRSCGLCAVVLAGCSNVAVFREDACLVGEDVVGEVCANDGDMKKEAYCTWMPTNATATATHLRAGKAPATLGSERRFVCAHCADDAAHMSAERRALMAQMLELRIEEDGREEDNREEALESNPAALAERDTLVVHR